MSYVKKNLIGDEQVVYQGHLSLWCMLPQIIAGVVLIPVFGVGLLILLLLFIKYISTELAITDRRVIAKSGFIQRNTIELSMHKIESIRVDQGILGRIFNYGSIVLAGAGNPQAPIPGISSPMEFRRAFLEEQETPSHGAQAKKPSPYKSGNSEVEPEVVHERPLIEGHERVRRDPPAIQ